MNLFAINILELLEGEEDKDVTVEEQMSEEVNLAEGMNNSSSSKNELIGIGLGFRGAALDRADFTQSQEEPIALSTHIYQISVALPKSRKNRNVAYVDALYLHHGAYFKGTTRSPKSSHQRKEIWISC